jgi:hypothetical protein
MKFCVTFIKIPFADIKMHHEVVVARAEAERRARQLAAARVTVSSNTKPTKG